MEESNFSQEPHPRPQLERRGWISLNGMWEFAMDAEQNWSDPEQVNWTRRIRVPFAPECAASGIQEKGFFKQCWYRRTFKLPEIPQRGRLLLHFGAVDYMARVWVNGHFVAMHEGGYTPFSTDISDVMVDGVQTVVVCAQDDPHDLAKPRGKQDWQLEAHSIWYPRTTGIWQTVWLEPVAESYLQSLRWSCSVDRWEIGFDARTAGPRNPELQLAVRLWVGNNVLAQDRYLLKSHEIARRIALPDPGIDDYRNELLWSPSRPTLIQARVDLILEDRILDSVISYTALRSIGVQGDRFVLNGRPYPLRLVLDQGYWPETGQTAPSDAAVRRDVELVKSMGFNGVRKHQKIECPGFYYWTDTLGLLVWEEMPSAYRFSKTSVERLTKQWLEVLERDISHPSIVAWMPFNESWGVPDLPDSPSQRHYVQSLYHLTKTLDPSRPVIGNDGWESVATDIIGIHDYDHQPDRIAHRYSSDERIPRLFQRERPGGRMLLLGGPADQPIMLTEFGGIAFDPDTERTWGYSRVDSPDALQEAYRVLMEAVHSCSMLAGFCYTQFTDTFQEANGLLHADRTPKFSLEAMRAMTRGKSGAHEPTEWEWRERVMNAIRTQYLIPADDYRTQST